LAGAGFGDLNGDGTTDMVLSRVNQGHLDLEGYLISNNQVTIANLLADVGSEWSAGSSAGVVSISTPHSGPQLAAADSNSQLVQAMASFGGGSGASDVSNTVPLGAETSQQQFLMTPQHA